MFRFAPLWSDTDQRGFVDLINNSHRMILVSSLVLFTNEVDGRDLVVEAVRRDLMSLANAAGIVK